jgi:hypothetical protein
MDIDPKSYDQALSDVDAVLADLEANVHGPMPEATWVSLIRHTVAGLRMEPEPDMNQQQEERLVALETYVKELAAHVGEIHAALTSSSSPVTVQRAMSDVSDTPVADTPKA